VSWAIPGLNTRETALVAWVGGFLLVVLTKRDIRRSFGQVLKSVLGSVLVGGVIAVAAAYATGIALLVRHLGHWDSEMTKLAVLWFVGFALVAVFNVNNVDRSKITCVVREFRDAWAHGQRVQVESPNEPDF
jgi:Na+/phosphate symporter